MAKGGWKDPIGESNRFVGVHVVDRDIDKLDELASGAGRSRSALIREAITRYLEDAA